MPIYEYQCRSCGNELEVLQKIADAPLTECPACKEPTLKKKISAAAFRLSGSGWYETDFKSGNKKNLAGDSEPAQNKGGEKSGSNSGDGGGKASAGETKSAGASTSGSTKADSSSKSKAG